MAQTQWPLTNACTGVAGRCGFQMDRQWRPPSDAIRSPRLVLADGELQRRVVRQVRFAWKGGSISDGRTAVESQW